MTNEAMTTWLGPAVEELTDAQLDRFESIWNDVEERYADDDEDTRSEVLTAAVQYLLNETTIDKAGARRLATRTESLRASAAAQQIALMAIEDGMSETEAARRASIDRMWLRKRLGK
jgi:hypothetical protein